MICLVAPSTISRNLSKLQTGMCAFENENAYNLTRNYTCVFLGMERALLQPQIRLFPPGNGTQTKQETCVILLLSLMQDMKTSLQHPHSMPLCRRTKAACKLCVSAQSLDFERLTFPKGESSIAH